MDALSSSSSSSLVTLKCVKEKGKLRVKITSPGYNANANCQFPRDIRKEGASYQVPSACISFGRGSAGTFFYRISSKNQIVVVGSSTPSKPEKVYGLEDEDVDCVICLTNERDLVFIPCGHFCLCSTCYGQLKSHTSSRTHNISQVPCPLCRANVDDAIGKDQL